MAAKNLIIISCSGRKREGGIRECRWEEEKSAVSRLSHNFAKTLLASRHMLAKKYRQKEGKDLGGSREGNVQLMPAYRRYDGNLYRMIDDDMWRNPAMKDSIEVVIVSALYGLLTPWEAIRKYELAMDCSYKKGCRLARWWTDRGLGKMLIDFVESTGASVVHDFLGGPYVRISRELKEHGKRIYRFPPHSYPGLGSGSDHHRGGDVRKLLKRAIGHVP